MLLRFVARLWLYDGPAAWHFVTLPAEIADEVRDLSPMPAGFGSIRVAAAIGNSTWHTSIFPDKASGSYVLPIKKAIREAEALVVGDDVEVGIELARCRDATEGVPRRGD